MSAKPAEQEDKQKGYGTVTEPGAVRIERLFPGPIERVWAYLTESEKRGKWLASGEMELREGGRVELKFRHADLSLHIEPTPEKYKKYEEGDTLYGRVTRIEPPRLLAYTWGEGLRVETEVSFELTPRRGDVLLVVTHRRLADRNMMVNVASGWHAHLGILIDNLNGVEPRPFWSTHARLEAEYEKRLPIEAGPGPAISKKKG